MARAPVTSVQSYATFKGWALPVLQTYANRSVKTKSDALYKYCYTRTQHPGLAAKQILNNRDLMMGMLSLAMGVNQHKVRAQKNWQTLNVAGCAMEYQRTLQEPGIVLSDQALNATRDYLHVYPANGRVEDNNWRIAANVWPIDIPEVARRMCQVSDQFANAGHFKVTGPGAAGKPDSIILYMTKDIAYNATNAAVLAALQDLNIQETFAPMWNELAPGIAVGAEPPKVQGASGPSFGSYRCLLTTMAFNDAVANLAGGIAANLTAPQFSQTVDAYFDRYGVPAIAPHDQFQIVIGVAPNPLAPRTSYITQQNWDDYLTAYAQSKGKPDDTYTNANAGVENRTPIV